ncbi:hypothetical protein Clacol_002202 [Clathrus columnatus]|uniref:Methylated-DNA--protein-cysteine methyltransferase n=1 Tax=Clathrus columnatus TaxID=1419009 RepID=A0AAV5A160_9AGAM|nr:hypothetical protein Clacol_002202 [Clathrus columnatus]
MLIEKTTLVSHSFKRSALKNKETDAESDFTTTTSRSCSYPLEETERRTFKTKEGKAITAHQWAVYDFVRTIPVGKVTTYKVVCSALGAGSPRSVGTALRNNPFAPFVPCHRVIASTGYIGGFFGEWNSPTNHAQRKQVQRKIELLNQEGVEFTDKGYLMGGKEIIWQETN